MKPILPGALRAAASLTRAGRLTEATAALQQLFGKADLPDQEPGPARGNPPPLPAALRGFLDDIGSAAFRLPRGLAHPTKMRVPPAVPQGGQFLTKAFSNEAGTRLYKLYVPSGYRPGRAVPLVVMLHGCTQSPDDFASGTRMNEAAEAHACIIAYPAQTRAANLQKCWNWFNASDQQRDSGEPSLIAGIARDIMNDYAIDPRRVYAAGLSAGGAAATIMGNTYPDLFAAIGVHSGLACGAASDMQSAFAAMQHGREGTAPSGARARIVPAIVFHGDRDSTVNARNGDAVVAQMAPAARGTRVEDGQVPDGYAYRRTLHTDRWGRTLVEHWLVHGGGHAWFGGSEAGSYTDPRGPDATSEMMRFFLEHTLS